MIKLLRATLRRYLRAPMLWLALVCSAVCGALMAYYTKESPWLEDVYVLITLFFMGCLLSLSVGGEHAEGAFRNQTVAGHTKGALFFSQLLAACLAASTMTLLFLAGFCALIWGRLSPFPAYALWVAVLGFWLIMLCFAVLFVTVSLLVGSRAAGVVVCTVLLFGMVFLVYELDHLLLEEEFHYMVCTAADGPETILSLANPDYVNHPTRDIFEQLYRIFPYGALIRYSEIVLPAFKAFYVTTSLSAQVNALLWQLPLYTLGVGVAMTLVGWLCFRKKDLK